LFIQKSIKNEKAEKAEQRKKGEKAEEVATLLCLPIIYFELRAHSTNNNF
jgi:hypothetical protein